jgi:hypothetical protein
MPRDTFQDKRLFQRIPLKITTRFLNTSTNKWNLAHTEDISANGIGIMTDKEISPHTPLEIWLPIPNKGEAYYTKGEVAWSRQLEPNRYHLGVRLDRVDLMGMSPFIRHSEAAI